MTNTEAWDYAIGMIKVDGLEPTKESQKWAKKNDPQKHWIPEN